jgi:glycosyltransferase involved in cell wall biosynthesis
VALVMIARDEAPRIERALASFAPFVDECVVLDTGSTDDTVTRAIRACGTFHGSTISPRRAMPPWTSPAPTGT